MSDLLSMYLMLSAKPRMQLKIDEVGHDPAKLRLAFLIFKAYLPRMPHPLRTIGLFFPVACLLGCAPGTSAPSSPSPTIPALTGYWQFTTSESTPPGAVILSGALQAQGSQVTGIFGPGLACSPPINNLTGTFDSSTDNLTLAGFFAQAQLSLAASGSAGSGTAGGGGYLCQVVWAGPVTATKVATTASTSLTGIFAGAITPAIPVSGSPLTTANTSLALSQSAAPNSSGQYPLTGTLTFTGGSCSSTTSLTGTLDGVWITLASAANLPSGQSSVSITAASNPTASQLLAGTILFAPNPCSTISSSATYSGTLLRQ
jgi:hypothetical protein